MRRVHKKDKAADLQPRGELNALSAVLAAGHGQLTNSVATLAVALGDMQGTGPVSRPPPAPGLDAVYALAAQAIGLDGELRNEKGRTAQLFQEVDSRLAKLQAEARRSADAATSTAHGGGSRPVASGQADPCNWSSDCT